MKRLSQIFGSVAVSVLILTGCGQATETLIESQTGADVEVSDGGETITFSDEESGTTVQGGAGTQLPAGFPSDIPEPPGGQLMAAAETPDGLSVMWTVDGLTAQNFDEYVATIKAAGYSSEMSASDMNMGDEGFTKAVVLVGNGQTVSITGFLVDGSGQVSIVVAAE
jgi:hypothetical protein